MAFNFPDSPNVNDEYTAGDRTWVWDGTVWLDKGSTLSFSELTDSTHASTHESGGSDEIEIAQSQVTGLDTGTEGFTAVSNGSAGLSYQPISHNYIINGAFDIWQRGDSFSSDGYTSDRWRLALSGATATVSKESFTPDELNVNGFGDSEFYTRLDISSAGGATRIETKLEDVRTLAGQEVTLSFFAKSDSANDLDYRVFQDFGSGGSSRVTVTQFNSFAITTSWVRYSFTLTLPSVAGKTIGSSSYLDVWLVAPSATGQVDLWGVQLEAGSIATPFKRNANSVAGELAACQRYYVRFTHPSGLFAYSNSFNISTDEARGAIKFPVKMREAPTSVLTSGISSDYKILTAAGNSSCTSVPSLQAATEDTVFIRFFSTGNLNAGEGSALRSNDAYLAFEKEL